MRLFKLILLLMLVAGLVPALVVGYTSITRTRELLVTDAQELAQERVEKLRLRAQAVIDEPVRAVTALSRVPSFFALTANEQRAHLAAALEQHNGVAVITVYDEKRQRVPGLRGLTLSGVLPSELAAHEARVDELLLEATARPVFSSVYASRARKAAAVSFAFAVGEPAKGYIAAELSLDGLWKMLEASAQGARGLAYVVDEQGRLVAGPALGELVVGAPLTSRPAVARLLSGGGAFAAAASVQVANVGEGEHRVVSAWSAVPEVNWAIVSEQPMEDAYRQVRTMQWDMTRGAAWALAVAILLSALFSRFLTRPLKRFGDAAMEIAKGHFGVQVDFRAKNELGELANMFNYMSAQIDAFNQENRRLYESLSNGYLETIVALANSIDSKDAYTRGHSMRVGDISVEIGRELGMTEWELKLLHYGGILHDVGKIGIAEPILCKQTRLTEEEMQVMREHPAIGDMIIEPVSFLSSVRPAVRSHHERWDGKGYPDGLKGEEIPLVARIVNCADTLDACTSTRPYQKAMTLERALEVLEGLRASQLDPKVLDALRRAVEKKAIHLESAPKPSVQLAS